MWSFCRSFFRPLKSGWSTAIDEFIRTTGMPPKNGSFFLLFSKVWEVANKVTTVKAGFRSCGIYRFDSAAVPHEAYAPSADGITGDFNSYRPVHKFKTTTFTINLT